ncbi:limonene-1,2-epoxide hydrolase [Tamilnaduibacter salinus]|uniref:Limonene-1,2-epoxide hydrolase n=1 Tax=Tamilnaduibacter salinus TaxID=1484056 RepID=A0A2A2I0C2_9GAMM|nr:nuclear transport factor 2 family protein [Tamilnaduibacter salinus]PAV24560.1 transcriptional regulator [Tamilnaduibacter salinus]PVY78069.1 limonene-1,2-epoxide hydrolase [Tamilnaduibacter salinus]
MNQNADCLERFCWLFNSMSSDTKGDLASVYGPDVVFTDPFTTLSGREELATYFEGAYANVIQCRFTFEETIRSGTTACVSWTMHLQHRRIRGGEPIAVDGMSWLTIDNDRIVRHRDYFDAGQLLYENVPVLGAAVRWLRKHAA